MPGSAWPLPDRDRKFFLTIEKFCIPIMIGLVERPVFCVSPSMSFGSIPIEANSSITVHTRA